MLTADCSRCFGLCCVAPAFTASADFAITKKASKACPHLGSDFRCGIHQVLRPKGFPGCTVFDCFGAGQRVSQVTFAGRDWLSSPDLARSMFATFVVLRDLHELLYYLAEARRLVSDGDLGDQLAEAFAQTEHLALSDPQTIERLDVATHRAQVNVLLLRTSELIRARLGRSTLERRGADLAGARLRGADLSGANLRGACLIGADLRGANLQVADLIGVDFRGADLRGADLTGSLFLIQSQLDSARGDGATQFSAPLRHPEHWLFTSPVASRRQG